MKVYTTKFYTITVLSLLAFVMTSSVCSGQEWSRKGRREILFTIQPVSISTTDYSGSKDKYDDTTFYGLGIGSNVNDNSNMYLDFLFCSPDSTVTYSGGSTVQTDNRFFGMNINLDYNILNNILKGRLTPLVTGGIGIMSLSGDVEGGGSFKESHFSYNIGVGLRWDIRDNLAFKAIYRNTWITLDGAKDATKFDGISVSFVYMF